jgi:hypothetical protein
MALSKKCVAEKYTTSLLLVPKRAYVQTLWKKAKLGEFEPMEQNATNQSG